MDIKVAVKGQYHAALAMRREEVYRPGTAHEACNA